MSSVEIIKPEDEESFLLQANDAMLKSKGFTLITFNQGANRFEIIRDYQKFNAAEMIGFAQVLLAFAEENADLIGMNDSIIDEEP